MKSEKGGEAGSTKGERTYARLRQLAASEFAKRGYHDTKVSDIVKAGGLTQPVFYSYFESKEAAYDELVKAFRQRLERLTSSLLITAPLNQEDLLIRATGSFLRFLDFLAEDPDLTEIGFFQSPACIATKAALASWIARNIVKEQAAGVFRTDIPAPQIGKCFVGMLDQLARDPMSAKQREKVAKGCAMLFCDGLRIKG